MDKPFESILARARALAALADPANGASPGEIENAQEALVRHLARYNLSESDISPLRRRPRELELVSRRSDAKPKKHMDLVRLAMQCLAFVVGEPRPLRYRTGDFFTPQRGLKPDKCWRIYYAETEVTDLEFEEWRDCFQHYVEDYLDSMADLQAQVREAKAALKHSLQGFCIKHNIYPANSPSSDKPISPEKLAALIAAAKAARGSAFTKKAGKIGNGNLLGAGS